jgi:guanylate kinase
MAELRKRITGRGSETEEAIHLRMSQTLREVSYIDKYDYCVVNGVLEEAVARVKSIVVAEHSRVSQSIYNLIEKYKEEV